MKPHQQPGIARSRAVRRDDEVTRRTVSSRSITEYDKWIEGIRLSEGQFGKPGYRSPGAWSSRIMSNCKSMPCNYEDERFRWHDDESDESDHADRAAGSPVVLWRKSPTDESSLMLHDHHEKVYLATREQEITDYRKEMMDMVRGLPESEFELTLQDIVEKRKDFINKEVEVPVSAPVTAPDKELARNKETKRKKNQRSYVIVERSKSIDTGLLARMFSPLSVVARRKSLNLRDRSGSGKREGEEKNEAIERKKNSKDVEWWKKNEFSEKGSNSSSVGSSTSNDSGSGGSSGNVDRFSRNMSMKQPRCSCFRPGKIKIRPGKMKPKSS